MAALVEATEDLGCEEHDDDDDGGGGGGGAEEWDVMNEPWQDLWGALEGNGWSRIGTDIAMPPPEIGSPRTFSSEMEARIFLRSFPHLLEQDAQSAEGHSKPSKKKKAGRRRRQRDPRGFGNLLTPLPSPSQPDAAAPDAGRTRADTESDGGWDQEDDSASEGDEYALENGIKDGIEDGIEDGRVGEGAGRADAEDWDGEDEQLVEINVSASLFDSTVHESLAGALDHMVLKYGFFLPETEYLVDLEGLVEYLHQKVHWDQQCLYCNRIFKSSSACKSHMVDASHCKLAYVGACRTLVFGAASHARGPLFRFLDAFAGMTSSRRSMKLWIFTTSARYMALTTLKPELVGRLPRRC